LLQPHEDLWEKILPASVEELLSQSGQERSLLQHGKSAVPPPTAARDKTRVVTYRAPHNSAELFKCTITLRKSLLLCLALN
jgi:major vault protein